MWYVADGADFVQGYDFPVSLIIICRRGRIWTIQLIFLFRCDGPVSVKHRRIVFLVYGDVPTMKNVVSIPESINLLNFFSCRFKVDLMDTFSKEGVVEMSEGVFYLSENLVLLLRADFLFLIMACLEATNPISINIGYF